MDSKQQGHKKDQEEDSNIELKQQRLEKQAVALNEKESALKEKQHELNKQEQLLQQREEAFAQDKKSLNERSLELETRHQQQERRQLEIEQGLPALRDEFFAEREQQLVEERQTLKKQRAELVAETNKLQAEREKLAQIQETVEGDFSEQRAELQRELQQKRSAAITKLHNEIEQQRKNDFEVLERELQKRRDDLKNREDLLEQQQAILTTEQNTIRLREAEVEQLQTSLEQKISERTQSRLQEFEQKERQFEQDKQRLLSRIERQDALHSAYDELQKALGDRSPEEVLLDLTAKNEELNELREALKRPSQELEDYYDNHRAEVTRLEQDKQLLQDEKRKLQRDLDTQEQLEYDQERLQTKFNSLEVRYDAVVASNNRLQEDLRRLNPSYNDPEDIKDRIKNIKRPYIKELMPRRQEVSINELKWLEGIRTNIDNYGLRFSHRILCAFHTALKIAEWSPLTVLAGVSGTGKSQLPELYSHFGGINFINVPVQPNWDSQESMLGYFNSISASYEAQPMLNFLVQSREKLVIDSDHPEDNYNGLDDTVSLVLLDEMNLAHVELYFADFLSKLEQRRGTSKKNLPHIDINLGSDVDPYKLSLGRNLLFAGTMNQDETTKSLSDKVIDRGTSIYFPRPNSLERREELKILPKRTSLLPIKIWGEWIKKKSGLSEDTIKPYKKLIEDINECLGADGKALGHRVWQSIEYYMVNHPLVMGLDADQHPDEYKDALKFAFEDQLVQKVMPKLRGIETRGYAKEHCLDPIRELLAKEKFDILDDFDKAMRIGHGQFSWASADYLNNEQSKDRYQELFKLALNAPLSGQQAEPKPESPVVSNPVNAKKQSSTLTSETRPESSNTKTKSSGFDMVRSMFREPK